MRILIVDPDAARRERLVAGLGELAEARLLLVENTLGVVEHVAKFLPDMVIVACDAPARDAIDDLRRVTETNPRPIVMFVDRSESEHAEAALRAGVAAYVVDGLEPDRIRSILDIASAQFRVNQEMRRDLAEAKADLAARKVIEQAKGVVMKRRGLDEKAAYALLRKAAMDQGKPLAKVAEELLSADSIFESASVAVAALARAWGAAPQRRPPLADDARAIARCAAEALETCDLLVLIGGASVGPHDHARTALASLGLAIEVEKIAVKPGKPTWFARGPRGAVLGLPGNPASALVCARLFLAPMIEAVLGAQQLESLQTLTADLASPLPASGGRQSYWRATLSCGERMRAHVHDNQDSSSVSVLAATNALLRQPAFAPACGVGEAADCLSWTP